MERSIFRIFAELQQKYTGDKTYIPAAALPFTEQHKIGISTDGYPIFFIECNGNNYTDDINLELISVYASRTCQLKEDGKPLQEGIYTRLSLKTDNIDFEQYFLDVVCIVLQQLPQNPTPTQLKIEIRKLAELFSRLTRPARNTVQGLWAELFIIEQALDPEYLLRAWHITPEDKFDFNDGRDKIEVKSTSQTRRIHNFAIEQLNPNQQSGLLIASIFTVQTGNGKNIFDLKKSIINKVNNLELQFRLNEIISQTLGSDFDKVFDTYFDYQLAIDSLAFFDFRNIPTIHQDNIPSEISNIHFACDLSHIPIIQGKNGEFLQSQLFRSLRI